jgi:hypothetical protein
MADKQDNENNDKSSLLKEKKPRPPQSEKQKENFRKLQEKRAENINKKKEEKILQAKRELLEKEGYVKMNEKEKSKEINQFNINDDDESDSEKSKIIQKQNTTPKQNRKSKLAPLKKEEKISKPAKKQTTQNEIIKEDYSTYGESENDTDSSEEIVIVRRTKKNKKGKKIFKPLHQEDYNEEEHYVARPNFNDFFL